MECTMSPSYNVDPLETTLSPNDADNVDIECRHYMCLHHAMWSVHTVRCTGRHTICGVFIQWSVFWVGVGWYKINIVHNARCTVHHTICILWRLWRPVGWLANSLNRLLSFSLFIFCERAICSFPFIYFRKRLYFVHYLGFCKLTTLSKWSTYCLDWEQDML